MGKLVVSLDGVVIKEVQITKDKTTLGRRPYNDIVIDNLAVSGKYLVDESSDYEKTMIMRPPAPSAPVHGNAVTSGFGGLPPAAQPSVAQPASIKVLNGAAAGREVVLTKVVTTVGKPGVQVASITKRPNGYAFAHVEGSAKPSINGVPIVGDSVPLRNGDVIELAGTQMQFISR